MLQKLQGRLAFVAGWILSRITGGALPPFAATTAVIVRDGLVLVIRRRDGYGYNFPGGYLRWDEPIETGLHREVEEETGYRIRIGRQIGIYSGPAPDQILSSVVVAYAAEIVGGEERSSFEGDVVWVPVDDLWGNLAFGSELILRDYVDTKKIVQLPAAAGARY